MTVWVLTTSRRGRWRERVVRGVYATEALANAAGERQRWSEDWETEPWEVIDE